MRLLLVLAMVLGALSAPVVSAAPAGPRDVIVQLFEWNWRSVAAECPRLANYGYVQVSPPQEHVTGPQWWTQYQPVSYKIESRLGTRAEFASMVTACHNAGVKVLVDAVINHTTGGSGTGWAGSPYTHYDHPGTYASWDFHHCGRNGNDDIVNYGDRWEVQNCELVNLADLATDTTYVRDKIAAYLNDLLSLGVDGFRLDASKHMPAADIAAIKSRLTRSPYIVQEVIYGNGEPIGPGEYTGNGDVHEFRYARDLKRVFNNEKLAYLKNYGEGWGYLPSSQAVVFVDNHDTQRDGSTLSYRDGRRYTTANTFMLAWPYGTPALMSGYAYSSNDQGPPQDANGRIMDVSCGSTWLCEHRQFEGMVGFRNATRGTGVTLWWDDGNDVIAFGRGDRGYVVVNDSDQAVSGRSFQTSMPAGTYCDVSGFGGCTTVGSSGWFTFVVQPHSSFAIHT
ncbi:alpha-amylase family protein [Lentzea sp. NPDC006480]|uniref:alpha-amylase n=1 Tax=Lentzea sp. NPDC006480 TaxID=3157176 RepID=UPI0033B03D37